MCPRAYSAIFKRESCGEVLEAEVSDSNSVRLLKTTNATCRQRDSSNESEALVIDYRTVT